MGLLRHDDGAVTLPVLVFASALGGGLLVGAVLGGIGVIDLVDDPAPAAVAASAPYYDCPGGTAAGTVHRGDRIFLTGRDASGAWVEFRSPANLALPAWLPATDVLPDGDTTGLAERSCLVAVVAIGETDVTTTIAPPDTVPSTTVPDTTTTTTTTLAGPSVGSVSASADPIWEAYPGDTENCLGGAGQPVRTTISAPVTAPAGIQSVTLLWSVNGATGSAPMGLSGGSYRATLGPFGAEDPNVVPQDQTATISVTVRVTDGQGRTATAGRSITLKDCTFG